MRKPLLKNRFLTELRRWLHLENRNRTTDAATSHRPCLLVVVEGRHDVEFLRRVSAILHHDQSELPDLSALERRGELVFLPAGGNDFRPWLTNLSGLGCAEFHLYDREIPPVSQQRDQWAALVNRRPRCRAFVTGKRSLENYLHRDAIGEARSLALNFSDTDDVAELAARAEFVARDGIASWDQLSTRARRRLRNRAKHWLNTSAVERMTPARLAQSDPQREIIRWLSAMRELLHASY